MKKQSVFTRKSLAGALALAVVSGVCSVSAYADDITQVQANSIGRSWDTTTTWSNGAAPSAGNDYISLGYELRTPDSPSAVGTATFGGRSLTIDRSGSGTRGILRMKATTVTIDRLTLGAAQVANNVSPGGGVNSAATLNIGTLTVTGTSESNRHASIAGGATGNHTTVNVTNLVGSGFLRFEGAQSHFLNIQNAAAYTGVIHLAGGNMKLNSALVLSNGAFVMNGSGVTLGLDYDLRVTSFTFGATVVEYGTYTVSQLNSLLNTSAFSGDGSLTVAAIPEASAFTVVLALALGAGIPALVRRRCIRR